MKVEHLIKVSVRTFGLLAMLFCFVCCKQKQADDVEKIVINPNFSDNQIDVSIKSIIPLETFDPVLIGCVNTLKYYEGKYYVFDKSVSKTLFVFDSSGNFLKKTTRGKGPGEIIEPWDFCINEFNNTIMVWDQMQFRMNIYDLNLTFIKSIRCPKVAIRNFCCLDSSAFLLFTQFYPVDNGEVVERVLYDYVICDINNNKLIKKTLVSNPLTRLITVNNPICKAKDEFFISPLDSNIYELTQDYDLRSIYKFDLGKYQITEKDLERGYKHCRPEIKKGNRVGPFNNLFVNNDYVSVSYSFKGDLEYFIYNRNNHRGISSRDESILKQLPRGRINGILEDNTFMGVVDALDYNEYLSRSNGKKSDATKKDMYSNQYIMLFAINEES